MLEIRDIEDPQLEVIQRQLLEAVFEPQLLQNALSTFAEFCGAEIAHLMVADGHRTLLQSTFSIEVDPLLAELEPQLQDINPRVRAIPMMKAGRSTQDKHFITRDKIARDPVYQELILPCGLGHFSAVPIVHDPTLTAGIALHRPFESDEFSDETIARHEQAAAVCKPVFELSRLAAAAQARTATEALNAHFAAISLKRDGKEVERNARMDALFEAGIVVAEPSGRVRLKDPISDGEFVSLLTRKTGPTLGQFIIRNQNDQPEFVANLMPLPHLVIAGELVGAVILVFKPILGAPQLHTDLIRSAYALTVAETEVASMLYLGYSVAEISDLRQVSKSTTQTLVKRVLQKTESRRQSELIKKLGAFA